MPEPSEAPDDRFNRLLGSSPEEVQDEYLVLRKKLVRFFERKRVRDPELLADETIFRAMKRVHDGADVSPSIAAFCHGIANFVFLEEIKKKIPLSIEDTGEPPVAARSGLNGREVAVLIRELFSWLPKPDADLFQEYHEGDRKELCNRLKTTENALRVRITRIKAKLEKYISQDKPPNK